MECNVTDIIIIDFVIWVLAIAYVVVKIRDAIRCSKSLTWPEVPGTVVVSELKPDTDANGMWYERPYFVYRYEVRGKTYQSKRIRFGVSWTAYDDPSIVEQYPLNTPVHVRVSPNNPRLCVLEPGGCPSVSWKIVKLIPLFGCGVFFVMLGMMSLIAACI